MRIEFTPSPGLFPFASRFHEGSAGRIHYVDEGEGRPIVLLHGNPTWSFLYRNVVPGLRDRFRCIAVDMPGFGLSDRPDAYAYAPEQLAQAVGELADALELEDFIVMGHDWGGPVGLSVAAERAERVHGLVLGNTWFWPPTAPMRRFSRVMSSPPLQWLILNRNLFVERILPNQVNGKLSDAEMEHYRAVQPDPRARAGVAAMPRHITGATAWLGGLEADVRERLGRKRVLIVWPMRDVAFRARRDLPRVREAFPEAELVELPEERHYFLEDASEEVVRAIRDRFTD